MSCPSVVVVVLCFCCVVRCLLLPRLPCNATVGGSHGRDHGLRSIEYPSALLILLLLSVFIHARYRLEE